MRTIVIGSSAIRHSFPDFKRDPKDIDIVFKVQPPEKSTKEVEYLLNPIVFDYSKSDKYLEPDLLLTLKMSHLFWDINWNKHMFDVQFLLDKGCKVNEKFLWEMNNYWKKVKPPIRRSRLEMSKKDFFTNTVNPTTDSHDILHEILNPQPMYKRLLKEGCDVELDPLLWNNLTSDEKIQTIQEEVMVMAAERFKNQNYQTAYFRMLTKFIQLHIPEFMFIFAVENYKQLLKAPFDFKTKLKNHV